jgi:multicomponent Na+:H+ antiporter subunit F
VTFAAQFLDVSVQIALGLLSLTFLVTTLKVIYGPTLPDRILALDMLVAVAIGFIAVIGIKTGYTLYLDIAIALGLVGFLATVAFARFILTRGRLEEAEEGRPKLVTGEARASHGEKSSAAAKPGAGKAARKSAVKRGKSEKEA